MNPPTPKAGFHYTINADGTLATIRGITVPPGVIAAPGAQAVPPESREVTPRAVELTAGIFDFAKMVNQPEPPK